LLFFVLALCERKNEKQRIRKYHAAVYPEPDEGQAKNRLSGRPRNFDELRIFPTQNL